MIGSPDLLAFTGAEGFGEGEGEDEAQALPEELSVPLVPPGHPWSSSAQFPRDFILVAEFSEQVMDFYLLWYFFACVFFSSEPDKNKVTDGFLYLIIVIFIIPEFHA